MTRRWSPVFACEREMRPHIVLTPLVLGVPACTAKSLCNTTMRSDSSMEVLLYAFCEEQRWQDSNGQQRRYDTKWWRVQCVLSSATRMPQHVCATSRDGVECTYIRTSTVSSSSAKQKIRRPIQQSGNRPLGGSVNRVPGSVGTVQTCGRPARSQHAQSLPSQSVQLVYNKTL
jgi:hypothetical protein